MKKTYTVLDEMPSDSITLALHNLLLHPVRLSEWVKIKNLSNSNELSFVAVI